MGKNELIDPKSGSENKPAANKIKSELQTAGSATGPKAVSVKSAAGSEALAAKTEAKNAVGKAKDLKAANALSDKTRPFNAGSVSSDKKTGVDEDYLAKKRNKKKKRNKILLWIGMGILGLILGVVGFLFWYKHYLFSKVTFIPQQEVKIVSDTGETLDIGKMREQIKPDIPVIEDESIKNFLLIGIDSRSKSYTSDGTGGLADVIMIMSVDSKAGTVKLISVARDSYAYVPGFKNPMKINAAMSRGGPELLQLTVENTLRIPIDGYAYVNFYHMVGVIDAVGGVYCNVTSTELYCDAGLNDNLGEINKISGYAEDYQKVNQTGDIWLNGRQAVAYARIRHADSDYKRSERQVEVLRSLLSQFMSMSAVGKVGCVDDVLGLIATNIPEDDIMTYAIDFLPSVKNLQLQYLQLPLEGFFNSGMYGGEWSIRNNWNMTIPYVQEFFYGERKDFDRVDEIPNQPADDRCPAEFDIQAHIS